MTRLGRGGDEERAVEGRQGKKRWRQGAGMVVVEGKGE